MVRAMQGRGNNKPAVKEGTGDRRPIHGANATIKDIAVALGVSHSTVSRALNDHRHISDEMKDRVRRAAVELGYVVNAGARTLRQANNRLIGLIVPDVMNQLFVVMTKVLAARCEQAGYQLVLCITRDDAEVELKHVQSLRQSRATGIIVVPTPYVLPETAQLMSAMSVVQISRSHPAIAAPAVAIDGVRGVANAVQHLADLGHRRIGYIGITSDRSTGRARGIGFTSTMERLGLPLDPAMVNQGPGTIEYGRAATTSLIRSEVPPTAIVYGTADLTEGGIESLQRENIAVPRDLSVVGFGDPSWLKLITPGISTVGLALAESAEAAISMLLRQIQAREEGRPAEHQSSLELEPYLILRGSTTPPRVR
jgi:LacI family transcriptional regulator